jgi:hypothetical protein
MGEFLKICNCLGNILHSLGADAIVTQIQIEGAYIL